MATPTRWRKMRTPCNLLIANTCAADLGVCVFAAPSRIIENYRGWIFGDVMCYILTPLQDVCVVVPVITHTVIALEKHRANVLPFKRKMTLKRVKTSVVVTWDRELLDSRGANCTTLCITSVFQCFPMIITESHTRRTLW